MPMSPCCHAAFCVLSATRCLHEVPCGQLPAQRRAKSRCRREQVPAQTWAQSVCCAYGRRKDGLALSLAGCMPREVPRRVRDGSAFARVRWAHSRRSLRPARSTLPRQRPHLPRTCRGAPSCRRRSPGRCGAVRCYTSHGGRRPSATRGRQGRRALLAIAAPNSLCSCRSSSRRARGGSSHPKTNAGRHRHQARQTGLVASEGCTARSRCASWTGSRT